jgi:16S rRNA C1402 (ribose-2'-O) methylase RsmI
MKTALLCCKLTKIHEETLRGTLASLLAAQPEKPKGEMVLVVSGKGKEAGK